jgi:anti-anti-sigma factor
MDSEQNVYKNIIVVTLNGRITTSEEIEALNTQVRLIKDNNINHIVFNLQNLDWMSSLGLGAFISYMTSLRNAGGDLLLCSLNSKMKSLFSMTRLDQVFKIYEDPELAVQSFTVVKN